MKNKDLVLLSEFRENARGTLKGISKKTGIPVSTIFDKLKVYEETVIHKHTSLLDFRKLGYDIKANLLLKVSNEQLDAFKSFLLTHPQVNSIYHINNGFDFLVEAVFHSFVEFHEFLDETSSRGVENRHEYFVLEDIAREQFMACPGINQYHL